MWFDLRTGLTSAASGLAMLAMTGVAAAQTTPGAPSLAIEREPPIGTQPIAPAPVLVPQTNAPPMPAQPPVPPAPIVVPPGPAPVVVPEPVKPGPVFVPETPKIQGSSTPTPPPTPPTEPAPAKPSESATPSVAPTPPSAATPDAAPAVPAAPAPVPEAVKPVVPLVEPPAAAAPTTAPTPDAAKPVEPAPQPETEEVEMAPRPVLFVTGVTTWDQAEEKLGGVFATLAQAAKKLGVSDHGAPLVEYIESDSDDVGFRAMLPVSSLPKGKLPKGVKAGQSPSGKALKFRHNGPLDDLEEVYGRIDDELAKRGVEAKTIVEQYDEDALASPEDRVVVDVYVFVK